MTRNQTGPHSPWLRWSALVVTALLAGSCGSGDGDATGLVTAMRDYVTAHDAVLSRVEEIPGFDSPPGRWFLLGNGEIYVSSTGQAADMEESGLPASVGSEFVDAAEALSDAAWRAEAPNCEGVETPSE